MRKNKKKYDKIILIARNKLSSIENLKSKILDNENCHGEFTMIITRRGLSTFTGKYQNDEEPKK